MQFGTRSSDLGTVLVPYGAIEPCLFVAAFFFETMFPTTVSSAESTFQRHIFLQNMESISIVGREDIWRIRGGNQGVLTEFSESTEMAAGSRSGAYRDLLCGGGVYHQW